MLKNNRTNLKKQLQSLSTLRLNKLFNIASKGLNEETKQRYSNTDKINYIIKTYSAINKRDDFETNIVLAKTAIIIPDGYQVIGVPPDNYCFYHSIVESVRKNDNIGEDLKNEFKKFTNGYSFKENLITKLINTIEKQNFVKDKIRKIWQNLMLDNGKNIRKNNHININYDKIILDIIENLMKKLWGGGPIIDLVAFLYRLNIIVYNNANNSMIHILPFDTFIATDLNTIYLYYSNNNHYDALVKTL